MTEQTGEAVTSFAGATYAEAFAVIQLRQQTAKLAEERWRVAKKQHEAALDGLKVAAIAHQLHSNKLVSWFLETRLRKGRLSELEPPAAIERLAQLDSQLTSAKDGLVLFVNREQLVVSGIPTLELLRLVPYESWPSFHAEKVQLRTCGPRVATLSWAGSKTGLSANIYPRHAVRPLLFFIEYANEVKIKSSGLPQHEVIGTQKAILDWAEHHCLNDPVEKLIIALLLRERESLK